MAWLFGSKIAVWWGASSSSRIRPGIQDAIQDDAGHALEPSEHGTFGNGSRPPPSHLAAFLAHRQAIQDSDPGILPYPSPTAQVQAMGDRLDALDRALVANVILDSLTAVVGAGPAMAAIPRIVREIVPTLRVQRDIASSALQADRDGLAHQLVAMTSVLRGLQDRLGEVNGAAAVREVELLAALEASQQQGELERPVQPVAAAMDQPEKFAPSLMRRGPVEILAVRASAALGDDGSPIPLSVRGLLTDLVELVRPSTVVEGPWAGSDEPTLRETVDA